MIRVGIIGFGTVGVGTVRILKESHSVIKGRTGLDLRISKIADIDLQRKRDIEVEP